MLGWKLIHVGKRGYRKQIWMLMALEIEAKFASIAHALEFVESMYTLSK